MANNYSVASRLPTPPVDYDQVWMNNFIQILRIYFNQIDNPGPITASSLNVGSTATPPNVVSGLSFIAPNPTNLNTYTISLPTQADLSNLRSGSVYYDTSAGNVLKIKP
jgi:hypothetical protein